MSIVEPTGETVARAAKILRDGGLVAFPTETVYGLGGDATNERAVAAIFEAKGRPQFNPLISHVLGAEEAKPFVEWSEMADRLAAKVWPGPLTFVLPRARGSTIALLTTAGLDTVAIRAPSHPVAQALIRAAGRLGQRERGGGEPERCGARGRLPAGRRQLVCGRLAGRARDFVRLEAVDEPAERRQVALAVSREGLRGHLVAESGADFPVRALDPVRDPPVPPDRGGDQSFLRH